MNITGYKKKYKLIIDTIKHTENKLYKERRKKEWKKS